MSAVQRVVSGSTPARTSGECSRPGVLALSRLSSALESDERSSAIQYTTAISIVIVEVALRVSNAINAYPLTEGRD